jgi:hypothetical protein
LWDPEREYLSQEQMELVEAARLGECKGKHHDDDIPEALATAEEQVRSDR